MDRLALNIDPYANDPGHWGASLVANAELLIPCLEAAGAKSVVEVGAYAGDVTSLLLEWAAGSGARVWAIDPSPQDRLVKLAEEHSNLELARAPSLDALKTIPPADAVIIDGDHNHYTVCEELRLIEEAADGGPLPLLFFHDVAWPHARRDDYFSPELIPEERRQPIVEGGGLYPGVEGIRRGGLPYHYPAAREGGPGNGVLTAVEDFVNAREGMRLAVVPAFFGFGVAWHRDAPYADAIAGILEDWDLNPLLERLEANRVLHLASSHFQMVEAAKWQRRAALKDELLRELLKSKSFSLAVAISRLRQRGKPAFSKDDVRRALDAD
jgi:predicted O-methyltransferase YrrM